MASKVPPTGSKKPTRKPPVAPKAKAASAPVAPVVKAVAQPVVAPLADIAPETPVEAPTAPKATAEPVIAAALEPVVVGPVVVEPVAEIIENTAPKMADTASKGNVIMETAMEKSQAMFAELNEKAKAAVEKNTKLVGEMTELAKGHVEALVESGKITAKGLETLGHDAAEYGRKSFEQATATMKSLAAVKSPADFFKLQSDYVRTAFDSMVAETSKNTEAFIKLAGEAAQPVSNRVAVAMEKIKTAA